MRYERFYSAILLKMQAEIYACVKKMLCALWGGNNSACQINKSLLYSGAKL